MNLKNLAATLKEKGGFSYSTELGDLSGQRAYAISLPGYEKVLDDVTDEDIRDYVMNHFRLLIDSKFFVGGWYNNKYYLDICDLWSKDEFTLDQAIEFGRLRNQISIHDLETGESHYTCDAVIRKLEKNSLEGFVVEVLSDDMFMRFRDCGYTFDRGERMAGFLPDSYENEPSGLCDSFSLGKDFYIIKK